MLARKKKDQKSKRLNSKTIRFDKKKWKHKVVLHNLINQWIFFLINLWRHQDLQKNISPKSLILQKEEISHLFLENAARMLNYLKKRERKTYKSAVSNKLIVNHQLAHFCFWQADLYRWVHYAFRNFFFSNIVFCYQKYATCCIGSWWCKLNTQSCPSLPD